jgi:hypothetical protein
MAEKFEAAIFVFLVSGFPCKSKRADGRASCGNQVAKGVIRSRCRRGLARVRLTSRSSKIVLVLKRSSPRAMLGNPRRVIRRPVFENGIGNPCAVSNIRVSPGRIDLANAGVEAVVREGIGRRGGISNATEAILVVVAQGRGACSGDDRGGPPRRVIAV